jgi:hypothetical protein
MYQFTEDYSTKKKGDTLPADHKLVPFLIERKIIHKIEPTQPDPDKKIEKRVRKTKEEKHEGQTK